MGQAHEGDDEMTDTHLREPVLARERMSPFEHAKHRFFAEKAHREGHGVRCARVKRARNWPSSVERMIPCTCWHSADANARLVAMQTGTFSPDA